MKPDYEQFRGKHGDPRESATVRLPLGMKAEAERFALAEGDNLTGLMIEGLARVIEDRKRDPEWVANLRAAASNQVTELEAQLAEARAQLDSLPKID